MYDSNAVFATLTYNPNQSKRDAWLSSTSDYNRFIQRLKRNFDSCQYLKVIEPHQNGYPHIHALLLFDKLSYSSDGSRYLPHDVFQKLKSTWTIGLSDYQSPRGSGNSLVSYVLKYLTKTSASKRLWSLILGTLNYGAIIPTTDNDFIRPPPYAGFKHILIPKEHFIFHSTLQTKRIKLLSWSRNFIPTYLSLLQIK